MLISLKKTDSSAIASTIRHARRHVGTATGQVFTLVVVCSARRYAAAIEAARDAAMAHPSRVLILVCGSGKVTKLDADIEMGENSPGDVITLRTSGELSDHADSVVLPLLLPDSPVVVWWPFESPIDPGDDPIGRLATRRLTDAAGARRPLDGLVLRAHHLTAGDIDLTWTRLTPWRALLAAALDQYPTRVLSVSVAAERTNAPAELMLAWLQNRLQVPAELTPNDGPGLTSVRLHTPAGDIAIVRTDGMMARFEVPGQPHRVVALRRRTLTQLVTEELGRVDDDQIFDQAMATIASRDDARRATASAKTSPTRASSRKTSKTGARSSRKPRQV